MRKIAFRPCTQCTSLFSRELEREDHGRDEISQLYRTEWKKKKRDGSFCMYVITYNIDKFSCNNFKQRNKKSSKIFLSFFFQAALGAASIWVSYIDVKRKKELSYIYYCEQANNYNFFSFYSFPRIFIYMYICPSYIISFHVQYI